MSGDSTLVGISPASLSKSAFLCALHFKVSDDDKERDFFNKFNDKLKRTAVPSIFNEDYPGALSAEQMKMFGIPVEAQKGIYVYKKQSCRLTFLLN